MPITKQSTVSHALTTISLDMAAMTMTCGFIRTIDGGQESSYAFQIEGAELAALFATQATPGQPLADEITAAIYNYAVSKGLVAGNVS